LEKVREWHFCKDGIRIVCVNDSEEYCYAYADVLKQPYALGLRTCRYEIGTNELEKLHDYIKTHEDLILNSKIWKTKNFQLVASITITKNRR